MDPLIDPTPLLNAIYDSTLDYGIFTTDLTGNVTTWNAGAERITGFSAQETINKNQSLVFTPEDLEQNEPHQEMFIALTSGRAEDYRWHMRKDGTRFWAEGVLTVLTDAAGGHFGYLKIFSDITERKRNEAEVYKLAHSDMLTGLANRYSFERRAEQMISTALRSNQPLALHLIDLDRFKEVNDSLGHYAGDNVLKQAAERMRKLLRESDFIARLGGDEFALLQPDVNVIGAGADLASKLNKELSQPFDIEGRLVQISGSIGISICPYDANNLDKLLKKADLALYRAKTEAKGSYHYYTERLDVAAHTRSNQISALRQAVERKEFWLEYQPQIVMATGELYGVEALLRCSNPVFENQPIEAVIGLAMKTGLIKNLSFWVLHEACNQLRKWKENGFSDLKICVNLCSEDLTDLETPGIINSILEETSIDPSSLEIEITERQALDVEKHGKAILNTLRGWGINIALDDFGTGYSALSYLTQLPVTSIKLDKSFLYDVPDNKEGSKVVKAVINLSHALGLKTIAEGVETDQQATFLEENNCTALQGFLISRPLLASDMTLWLMDGKLHTIHH